MPSVAIPYLAPPYQQKPTKMKKMFALVALTTFTVSMAQAQSRSQNEAQPTRTGVEAGKVSEADRERVKNAQRIDAGAVQLNSQQPAASKTQAPQRDIDAAIADLERHIRENDGKEGFNKEAYNKRLDYLRAKKAEAVEK